MVILCKAVRVWRDYFVIGKLSYNYVVRILYLCNVHVQCACASRRRLHQKIPKQRTELEQLVYDCSVVDIRF